MVVIYRKKGEVDGERHSKEITGPAEFQALLKQERSGHIRIVSVSHPTKPGKKAVVRDDGARDKQTPQV